MTDLFKPSGPAASTPTSEDQSGSALERLVGEGKKFKDLEALAKGKEESDAFIARVLAEKDELRADLEKRATIEDLMAKITAKQTPEVPAPHQEQKDPQGKVESAQLSESAIAKLVQDAIAKNASQATQERNLAQVKEVLAANWGVEAPLKLTDKAKELGVTQDFLTSMAASSPVAFLRLVGAEEKTQGTREKGLDFAPPRGSQVTQHSSQTGKTFKDYQKLRKEDPRAYHSRETQRAMHNDAMRLGADFYK